MRACGGMESPPEATETPHQRQRTRRNPALDQKTAPVTKTTGTETSSEFSSRAIAFRYSTTGVRAAARVVIVTPEVST